MTVTRAAKARGTAPALEERVFQALVLAADHLLQGELEVLRAADLTFPQYNVLRILRGATPERLSCGAISERMLARDSDLTRLLDRLQARGLVARARAARDRRLVTAGIAAAGTRLLRTLDGPVERAHRRQLGHMTAEQLTQLQRLAARVSRDRHED